MRMLKFALPLVLAMVVAGVVHADEGEWTGTLSEKPADAKAGIVAVLTVKDGDKEVKVNLWAEGATAKTLTEWSAKKAMVTVKGDKTDDNVKVKEVKKAEEKK